MEELEKLTATPVELRIGGELLALQPLKVGQLPGFVRAISPVLQQLTQGEIDWLALFGQQGDNLLSAIAIAVGKPRAWVDELAADEAILLAAQVIEVNADFFTRTVIPKLDGLFRPVTGLSGLKAAAGPTGGSAPSST